MSPSAGRAVSTTPILLGLHLQRWLGAWTPRAPVEVVEHPWRLTSGWDGQSHPFLRVGTSDDLVLSHAPGKEDEYDDGHDVASHSADDPLDRGLGRLRVLHLLDDFRERSIGPDLDGAW